MNGPRRHREHKRLDYRRVPRGTKGAVGQHLARKARRVGLDDRRIETAYNDILVQSVRHRTWHGHFPVVIDLHEEPFYGELPKNDPDMIRRGKAKAGTTHLHTFVTAYVRRRHRHFTLALPRVRAHESMLEVVSQDQPWPIVYVNGWKRWASTCKSTG